MATTVLAYALHTAAWITHQLDGDAVWPRWLEMTYVTTLVVVLLIQVPFFVVPFPAQALAQLTVTTAVVVLFSAYAWLDR